MVTIIDNADSANMFIDDFTSQDCIIIPIVSDPFKHSMNNRISLVYVYLLNGSEYLLFWNHSEAIYDSSDIIKNLKSKNKKYCHDKKILSHLLNLNNVYDASLIKYLHNNKAIDLEANLTDCHKYYHSKYHKFNNVNDFIPSLKHLEYCNNIKNEILPLLNLDIPKCYSDYDRMLENYAKIESNGLYVDVDKFIDVFGINHKKNITSKNLVYSQYNYNTITGRPSNRFGGINYAALNKEDNTRAVFASRNEGVLLEYDFDAYHLRLISDLIQYDIGIESVHEHLAKHYFDKTEVSKEEYEESKLISFRVLYGGIPKEFENIEFVRLTKKFIFTLWDEYNTKGFVETPLYKREMKKDNLRDMSPQKLFNYYIQAYETEANFDMIETINKMLEETNTKLILNTYDSFTLDFDIKDGKGLIFKIQKMLKYPTKIKWGPDYKNLKSLQYKVSV